MIYNPAKISNSKTATYIHVQSWPKVGRTLLFICSKKMLLRSMSFLLFLKTYNKKQSNVQINCSFSECSPRLPSTLKRIGGGGGGVDCMIDGLSTCSFSAVLHCSSSVPNLLSRIVAFKQE